MASLAIVMALFSACDRNEPVPDSTAPGKSVLNLNQEGQPSVVDAPLLGMIHAALAGDKVPSMHEELLRRAPETLLATLKELTKVEGSQGEKGGLAAVVLSVLAAKSPSNCVRYLTSRASPYGLHKSEGGLLAFRQAMEQWSLQSSDEAFARLAKLQDDPDMQRVLERIAVTHGESLALSMTGAMSIDDVEALQRRWEALSRKDAGAVFSRHLEKVTSPEQRDQFIEHTVEWVTEQWRKDGPQAVFDWAEGLTDDAVGNEVLDRVKPPQQETDEAPGLD